MSRHEPCECGVCQVRYFERNNFYHGKALTVRDLGAEQDYFNQKRWLINRMTLGWGIVCGLETTEHNDCVMVEPGLALDCCGREVLVCKREGVHVTQIAEALKVDRCDDDTPVRWALCLEYHECRTEQVNLPKSCDHQDRGGDYNRIRDGYRLSVRPFDDACPSDHSESCCPHPGFGQKISIHEALYERSKKCPACKDCECVLLTTGTLKMAPQEAPQISLDPDAWKYRRTVYTNPALASLLHCFHPGLAHITKMNWRVGDHYSVDEFLNLLTHEHLQVTFDRPMAQRTLRRHTCRLSIFLPSGSDSCPKQVLIPVHRAEYTEYPEPTATYSFLDECVQRELRHSCKSLKHSVDVELILHGSMILDDKGHALDAELIDDTFPTGNGVQGGEFIAYFSVRP
jgi:hypothetical protein